MPPGNSRNALPVEYLSSQLEYLVYGPIEIAINGFLPLVETQTIWTYRTLQLLVRRIGGEEPDMKATMPTVLGKDFHSPGGSSFCVGREERVVKLVGIEIVNFLHIWVPRIRPGRKDSRVTDTRERHAIVGFRRSIFRIRPPVVPAGIHKTFRGIAGVEDISGCID